MNGSSLVGRIALLGFFLACIIGILSADRAGNGKNARTKRQDAKLASQIAEQITGLVEKTDRGLQSAPTPTVVIPMCLVLVNGIQRRLPCVMVTPTPAPTTSVWAPVQTNAPTAVPTNTVVIPMCLVPINGVNRRIPCSLLTATPTNSPTPRRTVRPTRPPPPTLPPGTCQVTRTLTVPCSVTQTSSAARAPTRRRRGSRAPSRRRRGSRAPSRRRRGSRAPSRRRRGSRRPTRRPRGSRRPTRRPRTATPTSSRRRLQQTTAAPTSITCLLGWTVSTTFGGCVAPVGTSACPSGWQAAQAPTATTGVGCRLMRVQCPRNWIPLSDGTCQAPVPPITQCPQRFALVTAATPSAGVICRAFAQTESCPVGFTRASGACIASSPSVTTCPNGFRVTSPATASQGVTCTRNQVILCPVGWTRTTGGCMAPNRQPAVTTCPAGWSRVRLRSRTQGLVCAPQRRIACPNGWASIPGGCRARRGVNTCLPGWRQMAAPTATLGVSCRPTVICPSNQWRRIGTTRNCRANNRRTTVCPRNWRRVRSATSTTGVTCTPAGRCPAGFNPVPGGCLARRATTTSCPLGWRRAVRPRGVTPTFSPTPRPTLNGQGSWVPPGPPGVFCVRVTSSQGCPVNWTRVNGGCRANRVATRTCPAGFVVMRAATRTRGVTCSRQTRFLCPTGWRRISNAGCRAPFPTTTTCPPLWIQISPASVNFGVVCRPSIICPRNFVMARGGCLGATPAVRTCPNGWRVATQGPTASPTLRPTTTATFNPTGFFSNSPSSSATPTSSVTASPTSPARGVFCVRNNFSFTCPVGWRRVRNGCQAPRPTTTTCPTGMVVIAPATTTVGVTCGTVLLMRCPTSAWRRVQGGCRAPRGTRTCPSTWRRVTAATQTNGVTCQPRVSTFCPTGWTPWGGGCRARSPAIRTCPTPTNLWSIIGGATRVSGVACALRNTIICPTGGWTRVTGGCRAPTSSTRVCPRPWRRVRNATRVRGVVCAPPRSTGVCPRNFTVRGRGCQGRAGILTCPAGFRRANPPTTRRTRTPTRRPTRRPTSRPTRRGAASSAPVLRPGVFCMRVPTCPRNFVPVRGGGCLGRTQAVRTCPAGWRRGVAPWSGRPSMSPTPRPTQAGQGSWVPAPRRGVFCVRDTTSQGCPAGWRRISNGCRAPMPSTTTCPWGWNRLQPASFNVGVTCQRAQNMLCPAGWRRITGGCRAPLPTTTTCPAFWLPVAPANTLVGVTCRPSLFCPSSQFLLANGGCVGRRRSISTCPRGWVASRPPRGVTPTFAPTPSPTWSARQVVAPVPGLGVFCRPIPTSPNCPSNWFLVARNTCRAPDPGTQTCPRSGGWSRVSPATATRGVTCRLTPPGMCRISLPCSQVCPRGWSRIPGGCRARFPSVVNCPLGFNPMAPATPSQGVSCRRNIQTLTCPVRFRRIRGACRGSTPAITRCTDGMVLVSRATATRGVTCRRNARILCPTPWVRVPGGCRGNTAQVRTCPPRWRQVRPPVGSDGITCTPTFNTIAVPQMCPTTVPCFTRTTATFAINSNIIVVNSTRNIFTGSSVAGSGITPGSFVVLLNATTLQVTLSQPTMGSALFPVPVTIGTPSSIANRMCTVRIRNTAGTGFVTRRVLCSSISQLSLGVCPSGWRQAGLTCVGPRGATRCPNTMTRVARATNTRGIICGAQTQCQVPIRIIMPCALTRMPFGMPTGAPTLRRRSAAPTATALPPGQTARPTASPCPWRGWFFSPLTGLCVAPRGTRRCRNNWVRARAATATRGVICGPPRRNRAPSPRTIRPTRRPTWTPRSISARPTVCVRFCGTRRDSRGNIQVRTCPCSSPPTTRPSPAPSSRPTRRPTAVPTTGTPTVPPTRVPTPMPSTRIPTVGSRQPSRRPTAASTPVPTPRPSTSRPTTSLPTINPTPRPSAIPTPFPSRNPTLRARRPVRPISVPTPGPSNSPSAVPTPLPTIAATLNTALQCNPVASQQCQMITFVQTVTGNNLSPSTFTANMRNTYANLLARLIGVTQVPNPSVTVTVQQSSLEQESARQLQSQQSSVTLLITVTTTTLGLTSIPNLLSQQTFLGNENSILRNGVGSSITWGTINQALPFAFPSNAPIASPSPAPSTPTVQADALTNGVSANGSVGGLPQSTIIAIVVVIIIVVVAVAAVVYYLGKNKNKNTVIRGSISSVYGQKPDDFGSVSPAFAPHIARGTRSQRYSGAGMSRQSIELADYRYGGNNDDASTVASENPHFASPRLSLTRKSLAEHQMQQAIRGKGAAGFSPNVGGPSRQAAFETASMTSEQRASTTRLQFKR